MEQIFSPIFSALAHHALAASGFAALVVIFSIIQLWRRELSKL